jgi:hypothetical protein
MLPVQSEDGSVLKINNNFHSWSEKGKAVYVRRVEEG